MTVLTFPESEWAETAAHQWLSVESAASGVTRSARIAGGLVMTRPGLDSLFWNAALGFERLLNREDVENLAAHLRDLGVVRAVLKTAPAVLPGDWADICAEHGLTAEGAQIKWAARVEDTIKATGDLRTDLRVERVGPADARRWAEVMWEIFGMLDEVIVSATVSIIERAGWHGFAAWDGDEIVGTGLLYVQGRVGQYLSGTTLDSHRGRGVQSAMIAARARAAQEAGAEWLVSETSLEPGGLNASSRNLSRLGFTELYQRPEWVWQA